MDCIREKKERCQSKKIFVSKYIAYKKIKKDAEVKKIL